jgi:hypothetical protein
MTLRADTAPVAAVGQTDFAARAAEIRQQIQKDARHVLYLQAEARKQKDVIKLNCVNDKLILIKAEENIADSVSAQLESSIDDRSAVLSELQRAGESVRVLRQEAAACLGEMELYKQESGGEFSHPQFPDDPTVVPFGDYAEPPAYASPFS